MRNSLIAALLAAFALSGLAGTVSAQSDTAADLADVWFMVIKDGHDKEFKKAFTDHLKYRQKKGDTRKWRTYAPIVGDELGHYAVRYCCTSYAEMDAYSAWGLKHKMSDHWNDNVDPHVAEYRHYFQRIDLKNSNWPEEDPGFTLFGVTMYQHKMGTGASIEASKKALSDAAKQGGWARNWSWMREIGGRSRLGLVTPYMDYAAMTPLEENFSAFLARHHGEDKAREMLSAFTDNFKSTSYTVYRYLPDLSMGD